MALSRLLFQIPRPYDKLALLLASRGVTVIYTHVSLNLQMKPKPIRIVSKNHVENHLSLFT